MVEITAVGAEVDASGAALSTKTFTQGALILSA